MTKLKSQEVANSTAFLNENLRDYLSPCFKPLGLSTGDGVWSELKLKFLGAMIEFTVTSQGKIF